MNYFLFNNIMNSPKVNGPKVNGPKVKYNICDDFDSLGMDLKTHLKECNKIADDILINNKYKRYCVYNNNNV